MTDALDNFESLMTRPSYYFHTSEERQWEIDKQLGLLDVPGVPRKYITPDMQKRWDKRFK